LVTKRNINQIESINNLIVFKYKLLINLTLVHIVIFHEKSEMQILLQTFTKKELLLNGNLINLTL